MKTPDHTPGHTSRAKDPAIVEESQSIIKTISKVFWVIALVFVVWGIVSWVSSAREKAKAAEYVKARPPAPTLQAPAVVEALVLEHECTTPCSANIAWPFKIRGEGHPLRIKFQGVADWVSYAGEGDFQAPSQMRSGETQFVSLDPKRPHVRVQVYRKITVRQ